MKYVDKNAIIRYEVLLETQYNFLNFSGHL